MTRSQDKEVDTRTSISMSLGFKHEDGVHTRDWAKQKLVEYLVGATQNPLSLETLRTLAKSRTVPDAELEMLTASFNTRLRDPQLYASHRFSFNWLNTASRTLVGEYHSSGKTFDSASLRRFNRLLLEDAFPQYIERINNIRLAAIYKRFHKVQQSALCLSGGGIRSGTFALGILQSLARHNLLKEFHYLSTVSGGGYIGSWLTAWIHRHADGLEGVTKDLANATPRTKIDPDPTPIKYLRQYSNFITPKVGLLTADTWTFIGIYLRNLLLNWLVIIPMLLGLLTLPRLIVSLLVVGPRVSEAFVVFPLVSVHHIILVIGSALGAWSLAYVTFSRPALREELQQRSRFWRYRADQRDFLIYCLLPLLVSGLCLSTYWAWSTDESARSAIVMAIFGVVFTLLAWLIATFVLGRLFRPQTWKPRHFGALALLLICGGLAGLLITLFSEVLKLEHATIGLIPSTVWPGWLNWKTEVYACVGVPLFLLLVGLGLALFVGLSSAGRTIDDEDREWWARASAWLVIAIIGWIAGTAVVIFGPIVLLDAPGKLASLGGISGLLTILLGRSALTPATTESSTNNKSKTTLASSVLGKILPLLAVVFLFVFLAVLSLATTGVFQGAARLLNRDSFINVSSLITNLPQQSGASALQTYSRYVAPMGGTDPWIAAKIVHMNVLHYTSGVLVLVVGGALFVFGLILSWFIKLNIFSLHGGYRNRLIRAFLGASRRSHERKPNPFTGFDPADNVSMHELRPVLFNENDFIDPVGLVGELLRDQRTDISKWLVNNGQLRNIQALPSISAPSPRLITALQKDLNSALQIKNLQERVEAKPEAGIDTNRSLSTTTDLLANRHYLEQQFDTMVRVRPGESSTFRLMPFINTTLNLVAGKNLAWQQRKAEPFSITPLYCGCVRLGYRNSREYGGKGMGISIGTAATISGAAASPNMGYYTTSPVISLILALFNVRLGWWLGNPGPAGDTTYDLFAPKSSVMPIVQEALGLTNDENKYVYLTDGGHFENLGLYEMVLRRCHTIVVCDAAQDEKYRFGDLGNAIRKIRIDLGVPIDFKSMPIFAGWPANEKQGLYWTIANIRYSCIDGDGVPNGTLLYIKPAIYGTEPRDILEYKKSFPAFPHQSTADQFFDEPQFESYRMLGSHIMDQICGDDSKDLQLTDLITKAREKLKSYNDANYGMAQGKKPTEIVTDQLEGMTST